MGLGYRIVPLDCNAQQLQGGTAGTLPTAASYQCTLERFNISGYVSYDIPKNMPHTSYTRSCTINSINTAPIILRNFFITDITGANGEHPSRTVNVTLYNSGPGDEYKIRGMPLKDDGNWHACTAGFGSMPWQLLSCQYLMDNGTNAIGFRIQWFCDDRDPAHA
jgi:hypothetical protein